MAFSWKDEIKNAQRMFKRRKAVFLKNGNQKSAAKESNRIA